MSGMESQDTQEIQATLEEVKARLRKLGSEVSNNKSAQTNSKQPSARLNANVQELIAHIEKLERAYTSCLKNKDAKQSYTEQRLATRLRYEQTLSVCSQLLLAHIEVEEALTETLYELMVSTGSSRVYLCQNIVDLSAGLCLEQTHEISDLLVKPITNDPFVQKLPYQNGLLRWQKELSGNNPIIGSAAEFPESERKILKQRGAFTTLLLPVWVEGHWYGFVGFDDTAMDRKWHLEDTQLLQAIVDMIGGYIGRKRAEEAQRESEEKYRTLIEQSSDAVFLIYGGRFELINPQFTELFGVTQEDANAPSFQFTNIIAPQNRDMVVHFTQNDNKELKRRPRYEFIALDRFDNEINVELTVSYPLYKRGLATQGIIRDITERKRIEEEKQQAYKQIQKYAADLAEKIEEEQRQREIATILAEVVASVSLTLSTNELLSHILHKLRQLVRYDAAAIYLTRDDNLILEAAHGEETDFIKEVPLGQDALFKEMQEQRSYILIADTEKEHQGLWFGQAARCWIGAPLIVAQKIIGLLAVNRELPCSFTTSDARLSQAFAHQVAQTINNAQLFVELQETQERLIQRERLAALGQMAATVAHELRNPLMALRMGMEYLVLDLPEDNPKHRAAVLMQSNMARIERIVENILYVASTPTPSLVPGLLQQVLEDELAQWELRLKEQGINCSCNLTQNLSPILIDLDQIGRVITNLIGNGIDALEANSKGQLTLSLFKENGYQVITIADNGRGISEEEQEKIFEPFFTTKPRGTGLGLAIVKQIIVSHRGTISVVSQEEKGTEFIIKLPENKD